MKKLRWGIISTAGIAKQWLIPALQASPYAEVIAIASRNIEKAQAFAQENNITQAYGSYDELLADVNVDAIYNPLPNNLHVSISLEAIKAGKHVLCEKPLGMSAQDIQPLLALAQENPNLILMEAFMYRFHPQWLKVKEIIHSEILGKINAVEGSFSYYNVDPSNVRHKEGVGGGGLLDIGCYCISASRFIFDKEPKRVIGAFDIDPNFKVDRHATGLLDFSPGLATFTISTQTHSSQQIKIFAEKGILVIENPFYQGEQSSRLLLTRDNKTEVIDLGFCDHYVEQVNAFSVAVLSKGKAPTSLADTLANMKVLDGLFSSVKKDAWVDID